jgi:hypothetical protein
MAFTELQNKRLRNGRVYADGNKRKFHASVAPIHYESQIDSGVFDAEIDMTRVRINNAQFDGWRITQNGWQYALGQPSNKTTDGWVGFGGRQGQHWLQYRLVRLGYLHYPTRTWDDVGGSPTYNRNRLTSQNLTKTFPVLNEELTYRSVAEWREIWTTPAGGECYIAWNLDGKFLKEDIIINEAGRNWIKNNRPPTTPLDETFFGFVFQLDPSDIPKWVKNQIQQNIEDDFDDSDGRIEIRDTLDRLLGFMPIDNVHVETTDNRATALLNGFDKYKKPLRKRIWKDGDGNYYLLLGIRVDQLNQMMDGDLRFDPTWGATEIQNDNDDGEQTDWSSTGNWDVNGSWQSKDYCYDGSGTDNAGMGLSWQFPAIAAGATINECYLRVYSWDDSSGATSWRIVVEDSDPASSTAWTGTSHEPYNSITRVSTPSFTSTTFSEETWYFGESDTIPTNKSADIQSLVNDYGAINSGEWVNFCVEPEIGQGGDYVAFEDYNRGGGGGIQEAELSLDWTEGAAETSQMIAFCV